jgi:hypothetical protein
MAQSDSKSVSPFSTSAHHSPTTFRDLPPEILAQITENVLDLLGDRRNDPADFDDYGFNHESKDALNNLSLVSTPFRIVAQKKMFSRMVTLLWALKGRQGFYARSYKDRLSYTAKSCMLDNVYQLSFQFLEELDASSMFAKWAITEYNADEWDHIDDTFLSQTLPMFGNLQHVIMMGLSPQDWPLTYLHLGPRIKDFTGGEM